MKTQMKTTTLKTIIVTGNEQVTVQDASRVVARDNSKVTALYASIVTALDSSMVDADEYSKVAAHHSSKITARGCSEVTVYSPDVQVTVYDDAIAIYRDYPGRITKIVTAQGEWAPIDVK